MADTKKNIYQKVNEVKLAISKANLKKSGKNAFAKFEYYELGDFLPFITEKCNEIGLYNHIYFKEDGTGATLTIINTENDSETVSYFTPATELELKGCNKIQALGGVQTYCRRYLYLTAYDICEADSFDAVTWDGDKNAEKKKTTVEGRLKEANRETWEMLYKTFEEKVEKIWNEEHKDWKEVEDILQRGRNLIKNSACTEEEKQKITEICQGIKTLQDNETKWQ